MTIAVFGGLGRMGLRHCSVLNELGYSFDVYDNKSGKYNINYKQYDFFIVATPTETHAEIFYKIIKNNEQAKIFIEKPVVDNVRDLHITSHPNVFCGMIRRFDPLTFQFHKLLLSKKLVKARWYKSGKFPGGKQKAKLDLGIHIVDTWQYLNMKKELLVYEVDYSDYTYDCVTLVFDDGSCELFNYNERTLEEYTRPLKVELNAFLNNKMCNAYESHRICLE